MAQGDLTRIASNISGLNALNALKAVNNQLGIHQLRLATGKRINQAADDPAGLTIATKFSYKSRGLGVALDNIGDAKNLLAVAEGGLTKINDILLLIRDKAEQAANDALGTEEREAIKEQISQLLTEIDKIVDETEWNGQKLIAGATPQNDMKLTFQTGFQTSATTVVDLSRAHYASSLNVALTQSAQAATVSGSRTSGTSELVKQFTAATAFLAEGELETGTYTLEVAFATGSPGTATITLKDASGTALKIATDAAPATSRTVNYSDGTVVDTGRGFSITLGPDMPTSNTTSIYTVQYTKSQVAVENRVATNELATAYMQAIDEAIAKVTGSIKDIGAIVSRLTFKEENLIVAKTNTEAAYNRIMNADIAAEQLEAMKYQILQQTATAMLAQANVAPQAVLGLFR